MLRDRNRTIAVLAIVSGLAFGSPTATAQNYLTDLGAVAPGLGINNSGQVVLKNYLYSNGALTAFPANFTGAGINSIGQVVGAATPQGGNCPATGGPWPVSPCIAVWSSGTLTIYPGDPSSDYTGNYGLSINSSGQIVGNWITPADHGYTGAILFSNGVFTGLGFTTPGACPNPYSSTFGPPNYAYAINDAGQIAGEAQRLTVDQNGYCLEAFFYSQGVYTDIGPGAALALNATGQVVGELQFGSVPPPTPDFSPSPIIHAFIYDGSGNNQAQDLGTLPSGNNSHAYAINSQSLVVGASSFDPPFGGGPITNAAAFFYNGVMIDLNTFILASDPLKPYVTLIDARGINDSGLVIVNGVDSRDKSSHAYLLQAPLIQVAPGPLTFPSEPIGSMSPPQTATFTNVGTTSIALGAALVSSDFVIQSNRTRKPDAHAVIRR